MRILHSFPYSIILINNNTYHVLLFDASSPATFVPWPFMGRARAMIHGKLKDITTLYVHSSHAGASLEGAEYTHGNFPTLAGQYYQRKIPGKIINPAESLFV